MKLSRMKTRLLAFDIHRGTIQPIDRSIEVAYKFPIEIRDKIQLQRFLECVNYVADFIPDIRLNCAPSFK